ncbi:ESPR-type extended signal peptide-containing protein [uncultured Megamonas sp.]|uniref:ESPR-type extended signal peptide-containing protein n=1 Tax=uncultured Megamonas sp. TaxID=286140 RepID=UPI00266FFFA1|nr:ESPR-type extended signal peptide-containing protein [uncultured Megamonas sp.]
MNKIYKVIWSKVKNQYVVVSELAHSNGKQSRTSRNSIRSRIAALVVCGAIAAFGVFSALPNSAFAAEIGGTAEESQYIAIAVSDHNDRQGDKRKFGDYTYQRQTVTINNTKKEYWVREGYDISVVYDKRYAGADNSSAYIIDAKKNDQYNQSSDQGLLQAYQTTTSKGQITTLTGVNIEDLNTGVYGGASNAGGVDTPSDFGYHIKVNNLDGVFTVDDDGYIKVSNDLDGRDYGADPGVDKNTNFSTYFSYDVTLEDDGTYSYTHDGEKVTVPTNKVYSIGGKLGVFTDAKGNLYTGDVYGDHNEILLSAVGEGNQIYSYWGTKVNDPTQTIGNMTVQDYNSDRKKLQDQAAAYHGDDITNIAVGGANNKGTISLNRVGIYDEQTGDYTSTTPVPGTITITSEGGTGGSGAEHDVKIKFSNTDEQGEHSFTIDAGSKVEGLNSEGTATAGDTLTGIKINGEEYQLGGGKTYSAGKGIDIDENNKISVDNGAGLEFTSTNDNAELKVKANKDKGITVDGSGVAVNAGDGLAFETQEGEDKGKLKVNVGDGLSITNGEVVNNFKVEADKNVADGSDDNWTITDGQQKFTNTTLVNGTVEKRAIQDNAYGSDYLVKDTDGNTATLYDVASATKLKEVAGNSANINLDNITTNGQNVIKDLAKGVEKHIATAGEVAYPSDGYKVDKTAHTVTLVEANGNGVATGKNVVISDVASAEDLGNLTTKVNNGWTVSDGNDGTTDFAVKPGETLTFNGDDNVTVEAKEHAVNVSLKDNITLGDKITLSGEKGTATIGGVKINNTYSDENGSITSSTIDGLTNKEWISTDTSQYADSGKAATEAQLQQAISTVNGNIKTYNAGNGITIDTDDNNKISVNAGDGLTFETQEGEDKGKLKVNVGDGLSITNGEVVNNFKVEADKNVADGSDDNWTITDGQQKFTNTTLVNGTVEKRAIQDNAYGSDYLVKDTDGNTATLYDVASATKLKEVAGNSANINLDNITTNGQNVIKDLAKGVEKHIATAGEVAYPSDGYKVDKTAHTVTLVEANGNGVATGKNVVISDVASAEDLGNLTTKVNNGWTVSDGNDGTTDFAVKPGETLTFNGDDNVTVEAKEHAVNVSLKDNITLGDKITLSGEKGTATIGGVNITTTTTDGNTSSTVTGLTNKTLTDGTFATVGRAATEEQLQAAMQDIDKGSYKGWKVTTNKGTKTAEVASTGSVDFSNNDENIIVGQDGTNLTFDLNDNIILGDESGTRIQLNGNPQSDSMISITNKDSHTVFNVAKDGTVLSDGDIIAKANSDKKYSLSEVGENAVRYNEDKSTVALAGTSGTTITNVANGIYETDAVNVRQLNAVDKKVNDGWTAKVGNDEINVRPNGKDETGKDTLSFAGDDNITVTADSENNAINVKLNPVVTLDGDIEDSNKVVLDGNNGTINVTNVKESHGHGPGRTTTNEFTFDNKGATFTNITEKGHHDPVESSTNINGGTITTDTVKGLDNTTIDYEGFATEGKAATEEQLQQAAAASKTTVSNGTNTTVTSVTDPTDGHVDYQVNLNDNVYLGGNNKPGSSNIELDGENGTIQVGSNIILDSKEARAVIGGVDISTTFDDIGKKSSTITGLSNTTWDTDKVVIDRAATEGQLQMVSDKVTAGWTATDDAGNKINVNPETRPTLNFASGKNITVSAVNDEVEVSLNDNINLNDRVYINGKPAEGNNTIVDVKSSDKSKEESIFAVEDKGNGSISIGGIDITNENGPYLAVGDGKLKFYKDGGLSTGNATGTFSVRPDGDLEISGKNSSFNVDAETGNVNAINSSGSAIMMNDDSVALNASGNGVVASDEGILLNTNGIDEDIKLVTKGTSVSVDNDGATFTNTNTNETTNINGGTINVGDRLMVEEDGSIYATNNNGSTVMINDNGVALNSEGNGVAISDEGITLNTNGSTVAVDRFNGATFTNTNTTESTNINGATITTGTVKGLKNTTIDYEGFATEGKAATEEQLKQAAAASKTTISDGINTTVTSTEKDDGHVDYQVNLNKNINLNDRVYINGDPEEGNNTIVDIKSSDTSKEESIFAVEDKGNGSISIGGIDITNENGPYLAVGDGKLKFYKDGGLSTGNATGTFSVRPDGDLEISGKNSSFNVDAETGNVNAINSSGSAIMMNDDSVALNASGNGVVASDEGILLNTNGIDEDIKLVTKGTSVSVDNDGATFTNTNTNETTNINGGTINVGDRLMVEEDGSIYATNNNGSTVMINDNGVALNSEGNGVAISDEGITLNTNGSTVAVDRFNGATFTNTNTTESTNINGATITTGTVKGLKNTTIDYEGFATEGKAATEEQLKQAAAASKTTISDGINTTVTSTEEADGHIDYKVNLNDNITLGNGQSAITLNGSPQNSDDPALSVGTDKFVVAQDGSLSVSDKFNVDAETGNIYAANNSGSAIMMNDDSVALNAGGNGVVASDEGILLNTNGFDEDIKLVTKGTTVSVDKDGTTFTNVNTNETTNIDGGTINVGDRLMVEDDGSIYATNNNGSTVMINDNGVALNSEGNGVAISDEGILLNTNGINEDIKLVTKGTSVSVDSNGTTFTNTNTNETTNINGGTITTDTVKGLSNTTWDDELATQVANSEELQGTAATQGQLQKVQEALNDTTEIANAGWNAKAGDNTINVKPDQTLNFEGDGNITVSATSGTSSELKFGLNHNITLDNIENANTMLVFNTDGKNADGISGYIPDNYKDDEGKLNSFIEEHGGFAIYYANPSITTGDMTGTFGVTTDGVVHAKDVISYVSGSGSNQEDTIKYSLNDVGDIVTQIAHDTFTSQLGDNSTNMEYTIISNFANEADKENPFATVDGDGNPILDENGNPIKRTIGLAVREDGAVIMGSVVNTDGIEASGIRINDPNIGGENTITGLANTTWAPPASRKTRAIDDTETSKAATQGQLDDLYSTVAAYDINADGTVNYNHITLAGDAYSYGLSRSADGTPTGGTSITNVAYASGNDGSEAVNVDYLNDAIKDAVKDGPVASNEKHLDTSKTYTPDKTTGTITINEVDGTGAVTGNQLVINDVASKAELDSLKTNVGDLNYDKVTGDKLVNGDSVTTAIGKLDNKIDNISGTATNADNNTVTGGTIKDDGTISLTQKDGDTVALDGKLTDSGVVQDGTKFDGETGTLTITSQDKYNKGTSSVTVSGIASKDDIGTVTDTIGVTSSEKLADKYKDADKDGNATTAYITDSKTMVDADVALDHAIQDVANTSYANDMILSNRIDNVENRLGEVEERIDKVGAMAAAIANLRTMGFDPEAPTEIAVGVGQYKSETGIAIGVFHYPNQDFMLSASLSTSGDEVMGGIGATWRLGRKSSAERAKDEEAKHLEKAEEMKKLAQQEKVKAQAQRHAKLLEERQHASQQNA